jgi:hypothetical protein
MAYYEGLIKEADIATAAQAIVKARADRNKFVFQGETAWKLRKDLKASDEKLTDLQKAYEDALQEEPLVNKNLVFHLAQPGTEGTYPEAPDMGSADAADAAGAALKAADFLQTQKADAFLYGSIIPYQQRYYLKLAVWEAWMNGGKGGLAYSDDALFSFDEADKAAGRMALRLLKAVTGGHTFITVHASPEQASINIAGVFAGQGSVENAERSSGPTTVTVFAPGYKPQSASKDLASGSYYDFKFKLKPIRLYPLNITAPTGLAVYQDSYYQGLTPLRLSVDSSQGSFIQLFDKKTGAEADLAAPPSAAMPAGQVLRVNIPLKLASQKLSVEQKRKQFYVSWGAFWVILPATIIFNSMATGYMDNAISNGLENNGMSPAQNRRYHAMQYTDWALWGVTAVSAVWMFIESSIYLGSANSNAPVLIK